MSHSLLSVLAVSLLLLASASTSTAIENKTISDICSKSSNSTLCTKFLESKPKVAPSDLKGVEAIVLAVSTSRASITKSLIASLAKNESDPKVKQVLNECVEQYVEALKNLDKAKKAVVDNQPKDVNIRVSAAQTSVGNCKVDGHVKVSKKNKIVLDTISIALVISNML